MSSLETSLQKYAELIVKLGVNVQPGQTVLIRAPMERVDLVRKIAAEAYLAGAVHIEYEWHDDELTLARYQNAPAASFEQVPQWVRSKYEALVDEGVAVITISAPNPQLLRDVNRDRVAQDMKTTSEALTRYTTALSGGTLRRTVAAAPTIAWAKEVFPDLSEDDAVQKLWDNIFMATRVNQENPMVAWTHHVSDINRRLGVLHQLNLRSLHFQGPGTELTVELPRNPRWIGGGLNDPSGVFHAPNIPTEEVFTAPQRGGVNGIVRSTKPLNHSGNLIENFTLTFVDGKIVDCTAEHGKEILDKLIATDEGSHYLGEVALVPDDSPISKLNVTFKHTLFDENASCHLAIGTAYPFCIEGGTAMNKAELLEHGLNTSLVHVDFMIGSDALHVQGETVSGEVVPLFKHGNWVV